MKKLSRGQTAVIMGLAIPILVGAVALGTDIAMLYLNYIQLQKAADAAALAGANYLPDNAQTATSTAQAFAVNNGVKVSEITSNSVGANNASITVSLRRTVPYYFARVLGLTNGVVSVSATSGPQYPPNTVNAPSKSAIPPGGDNNGNNGITCSNTGSCGLLPFGLDSHTTYTDGAAINLQQGQVGPGNWDLLALGGTGGNNLRTNIANGYNGMITVGDWITTEPGKKVGPVDQGIQDRLDLAASVDPSGTYSSHKLTNPRMVILPVVNWTGQNGRKQVQVTAFASFWIDSYSGGQVSGHFISQVIPNSYGDPNAPYFGAKGSPILLK
jgi:Flp pilus assembly protein TadG